MNYSYQLKSIFIAVMLLVVAAFATSKQVSNIQSAMRAFVDEEGEWAKSHRDAYQAFLNFQHTQNPRYYEDFERKLTFNRGITATKKQLDLGDYQAARETLLEIGSDIYNIEKVIHLTKYFSWLEEAQKAFKIWDEANALVSELELLAATYKEETSVALKSQLLRDIQQTQKDMLVAESEFEDAFIRLAEQTDQALTFLSIIVFTLLGLIIISVIQKVMNKITEKDELYQATFNKSQLAYIQFKLNGDLMDANQQFLTMIHANQSHIKSLNFFQILKNQGNPSHLISFKNSNKHQEFQFKLASDGNQNKHFNAHTTLIHNYSGTPLYFIAAITDVSEQKAQTKAWKKLAHKDHLTDLMNRMAFEKSFKTLQTSNAYGYLLYMDLNGFKAVNDRAGHIIGDKILAQVSQKIKKQIRQSDELARMGGDEFALFLENVTLKRAIEVAKDIRQALSSHDFEHESFQFDISISIGIAGLTGKTKTFDELIHQADEACYLSKTQNQVVVHQSLAKSA